MPDRGQRAALDSARGAAPDSAPGEAPDPQTAHQAAHQRLDTFLWHARLASQRTACAELASSGLVRINRMPTDKPHAKVRVGDVLTIPLASRVAVLRVVALAERRGSAEAARALYKELPAA